MQTSKEYLNALTCKFYTFSRQNSKTFDIRSIKYHKVINSQKQSGFFGHSDKFSAEKLRIS